MLETLFSAQKFYSRHNKGILVSIGAVLALIIVLVITSVVRTSSNRVASELLAGGVIGYQTGNFMEAINKLDQLVAEYPGTPAGREALYYLGKAYLSLENVTEAKQWLHEYQKEADSGLLLIACLGTLAGIAESQGQYIEAAGLFERASSMAEYTFSRQQNQLNAASNWFRAGNYEKASAIVQRLRELETLNRVIEDEVDELSSRLKIAQLGTG